jgi:hypothetical protein
LPVIITKGLDDLAEPLRTRMEEAYLEACREIGGLLLAEGRVREAWMYLRPLGNKAEVAAALEKLPVDEHYESIVEIALHEGVAPALGFRLVLSHQGICNAISLFDAEMANRPRSERQTVAGLLVSHLHQELLASLKKDIAREQGSPPRESTVADLVAQRDWLFANDNYHIDTTHLSSVIRFAWMVDDPDVLRRAVDLTEYGRRLSAQFQFPGDDPFSDLYPASGRFFRALLGEGVDETLSYFQEQATRAPIEEIGPLPAEVYVSLLARSGRNGEAMDAADQLLPPGTRSTGFAPSMLELARVSGDFERLMRICRQRQDLVGFIAGLAEKTIQAG